MWLEKDYVSGRPSALIIRLIGGWSELSTAAVFCGTFAILANLLIWNQRVSINELSERFHVGRSSIQNDLKWLRETFPTIQIKSCKGQYGISGSGTDFMKSLVVFNIYGVRKMTYCIYS